ncbi:MAG: carbohydrate kinase family protein [Patescibacteria group bacterium]
MYDVITIGAATKDVFLKSKDFNPIIDKRFLTGKALAFDLNSKNEVDDIFLSTGGGATNAAVTFARQGFKVASVVRVGNDASGKDVIEDLNSEGVDCSLIQKDRKPGTGYSTLITATDGSRVVLVKRGFSSDIKYADIDFSKMQAKWFYISSLGGNLNLLSKLLNFAKKNNIYVAFNPGNKELAFGITKLKSFFKKVHLLIINQDEASSLLNIPFKEEKKIFKELDDIIAEFVVMTKGKDGVSVSDGKDIYCAGIPNSPIIERTGAGDAFGSGFVASILHGKDVTHAIQFATANSTSVIQYFSAKTGILKKSKWGKYPKVKVSKDICY